MVNGALVNAFGILLGGVLPWFMKKPLSARHQSALKVGLGVFAVFLGLRLTWMSLNGSIGQKLKLLGIILLAMVVGKLFGKLLRLQKLSNRLGRYASAKILAAEQSKDKFNDGFVVCTSLFCAAPLALLGAVHEGLEGFSFVFIIKALMDGAAAMAFATMYGSGVILSALPVFAAQAGVARLVAILEPWLRQQPWPLVDSINATNGLLIFCVALIILQLKKIEVTDYLPSLIFAPVLVRLIW